MRLITYEEASTEANEGTDSEPLQVNGLWTTPLIANTDESSDGEAKGLKCYHKTVMNCLYSTINWNLSMQYINCSWSMTLSHNI